MGWQHGMNAGAGRELAPPNLATRETLVHNHVQAAQRTLAAWDGSGGASAGILAAQLRGLADAAAGLVGDDGG